MASSPESSLHEKHNVDGATSSSSEVDQQKETLDVEKGKASSAETEAQASPAAPTPVNPWMDPSSFPDGGFEAWLVVLGASCALFVSFGWINCIGIFQAYYETHQLKDYSPSTIAWITSLEASLMFLGGSWVGRVYDNYGPRWLILVGTFLHVFGLMMASISTKYYQFLLSQGICSPLGASMIFFPAMSTVVTWFHKKRGIALGLTAVGSSLGGVILPIMVARLVPKVGFGWTMRICAFLILGLLIVSNLTVKSRIPPHPRPVKIMDFISPLREPPFFLLSVGMFLYFFGVFQPFTFVVLKAQEDGMGLNLSEYLIPILNGASVFGRTIPPALADRFGRFNVMVIMAYLAAIIVLAIWIPTHSNAANVVFSALFGFASGSIVSLAPALIAQISDVRQIGVRSGSMFTLVAVAVLVGSPIGGALITDDHGKFTRLQLFAGCMMLGGSTFIVCCRVKLAGFGLTTKV